MSILFGLDYPANNPGAYATPASSVALNSAFQPNASAPCQIYLTFTLSGVVSLASAVSVQWSATSGGTYQEIMACSLVTLVGVLTAAKHCAILLVPAGMWLKIVATGGTPVVSMVKQAT
jgi:hypothetical protein